MDVDDLMIMDEADKVTPEQVRYLMEYQPLVAFVSPDLLERAGYPRSGAMIDGVDVRPSNGPAS